jgi:pilus assembly protein FimV
MSGELRDRHGRRLPSSADQTAEVSIDDLGLDLDPLEQTDHPADAPTLVAGIDESSRRVMAEAEQHALDATQSARERDLSEMERELEASFVAEPDLGRESAPTVLMPHDVDVNATQRFNPSDFAAFRDLDRVDLESTSRLRSVDAESIDLDLDRLSTDLNDDETLAQGAEEEDLFSNEVFESTLKAPGADLEQSVDLDVGDAMFGVESPSERLKAQTNKLQPIEMGLSELDPPTMSEVGTKLDLARAYMDMGDPEGARSILEEVVLEGTDSQKQEASRLIESLPG